MVYERYTLKLSTSFFENTKVHKGCKNKEENDDRWRFIFLVEGWSIEGSHNKNDWTDCNGF